MYTGSIDNKKVKINRLKYIQSFFTLSTLEQIFASLCCFLVLHILILPCNAWQACAWYDSFVKLAANERIASRFFGCNFKDFLKADTAKGSCSFFAQRKGLKLVFKKSALPEEWTVISTFGYLRCSKEKPSLCVIGLLLTTNFK